MEHELGGSTMIETFENLRKDQLDDDIEGDTEDSSESPKVDIDLNLLKNLLESHSSQIGIATNVFECHSILSKTDDLSY
jgi:hypothetical protein